MLSALEQEAEIGVVYSDYKPVLLNYAVAHNIPTNGGPPTKASVVQSILAHWQ